METLTYTQTITFTWSFLDNKLGPGLITATLWNVNITRRTFPAMCCRLVGSATCHATKNFRKRWERKWLKDFHLEKIYKAISKALGLQPTTVIISKFTKLGTVVNLHRNVPGSQNSLKSAATQQPGSHKRKQMNIQGCDPRSLQIRPEFLILL